MKKFLHVPHVRARPRSPSAAGAPPAAGEGVPVSPRGAPSPVEGAAPSSVPIVASSTPPRTPTREEPAPAVLGEKVRVTVHRATLPEGVDATRKVFVRLAMLSADGAKVHKERTAIVSSVVQRADWDETFEFPVDFEGQLLQLELVECEVFLGHGLRKRVTAKVAFQVYLSRLRAEPVRAQAFRLRDPSGETLELSTMVMSLQCQDGDTFWDMFERHEVDFNKRADIEGFNEDQAQVTAVLQHLKPTLEAWWVILYVVLRPIYWLIVDIRSVLTDWEDPGLTIIYFVVGMYLWWLELVAFGLLSLFTYKLFRVAGTRQVYAHELDAKTMLREYQVARDVLKYGRRKWGGCVCVCVCRGDDRPHFGWAQAIPPPTSC